MVHKTIILLLTTVMSSQILFAQQDKTKEINKIKTDRNYLAVTGTSMSSEEEASTNAQIMLIAEIDTWLKENSQKDIEGYTTKAKKNISLIQTKLGRLYRAFAYVKKSDILPYYKDEIIITEQIESPTKTISIDTTTVIMSQFQENVQKKEPSIPTPQNAQPILSQEEQTQSKDNLSPKSEVSAFSQMGIDMPTEEKSIKKLYTIHTIKKYISSNIKNGLIEKYSNNISEIPTKGTTYLILLDYHGIARKYIRINQNNAINLVTSESEDIDSLLNNNTENYSFIWFTFK